LEHASIPEFFPNKEAIFDVAVTRNLERLKTLYDEELFVEAARPLLPRAARSAHKHSCEVGGRALK